MDGFIRKRLTDIIDKATDRKALEVEPEALSQLKQLCRNFDGCVSTAYELLQQRLKDAHCQVRLHALRISNELFLRSQGFRTLLAPNISPFLALTVGHRSEAPLPGPADVATQLRQAALEALEIWDERFGSLYGQIRLAHRYLKNVMRFEFPELRARAAAAEAEGRAQQARAQAIAQEKYERLNANFDSSLAELLSPVEELEHTFAIIEGRPDSQAAEWDAEDWEDVEATGDEQATEGLAAYAGTSLPHSIMSRRIAVQPVDPALAESACSTVKLLQTHTLPLVQEWLRLMTKAHAGEPGSEQHARHNAMTQATIGARSRMSEALERYASMESALTAATAAAPSPGGQPPPSPAKAEADANPSEPGQSAAAPPEPEAAGVHVAGSRSADADTIIGEVFGDSDGSSDGSSDSGSDLDAFIDSLNASRKTQVSHAAAAGRKVPPPASATGQMQHPPNLASIPADRLRQPRSAQQQAAQALPTSRSPAAAAAAASRSGVPQGAASPVMAGSPPAREDPTARASSPPAREDPTARIATRTLPAPQAPPALQPGVALSADLKQRLLAQAPEVPGGSHLTYWDSDKARALVNARGMELSNHWGPVDAHKELSDDVLAQFFGTRASYYVAPTNEERLTKAAQEAARRAQAAAQPPAPSAARPQPISQPPPKPKPRVTAFRNPLLGGLPGQQQEITPQKLSGALPQEAGRSHPSGPQTPAQTSGAGASPVATSGALPGVGPQGVSRTASQPKRAAPGERSAQHSAAQPEQADQVPAAGGQAGRRVAADPEARQRAEDRAHNAAILGQMPDEDVARGLAEAESWQGRDARSGRAPKRKAPSGSTRSRLARKLLGPRGTNAALGEMAQVEGEVWREREGNKW